MLGFCVDFINKMYLDFAFTEHVKLCLSTGHLIYLHLMELMIYVDLNVSFHLLSIWLEYSMLHFSLLATFESIQAIFYYSIPPLSHQL